MDIINSALNLSLHALKFYMSNIRNVPAGSALTQILHQAIMCVLQIITFIVREKGMEHKGAQRRTKVSFGRA